MLLKGYCSLLVHSFDNEKARENVTSEQRRARSGPANDIPPQGAYRVLIEVNEICKLTIVIKVKQNCQKNCKGYSNENVSDVSIPEMDQPPAILSWEESLAGRKRRKWDILHMSNVNESGKEDYRKWRAVIFNECAYVALEEIAASNGSTSVSKS